MWGDISLAHAPAWHQCRCTRCWYLVPHRIVFVPCAFLHLSRRSTLTDRVSRYAIFLILMRALQWWGWELSKLALVMSDPQIVASEVQKDPLTCFASSIFELWAFQINPERRDKMGYQQLSLFACNCAAMFRQRIKRNAPFCLAATVRVLLGLINWLCGLIFLATIAISTSSCDVLAHLSLSFSFHSLPFQFSTPPKRYALGPIPSCFFFQFFHFCM